MSVYVDDAMVAWRGKRWCHLYADSLPELESFARKVGLRPDWLQYPDGKDGLPHYDVTGSVLRACKLRGAIPVTGGDGTYRRLRRALGSGKYILAGEEAKG
jgi:hypothetical protein